MSETSPSLPLASLTEALDAMIGDNPTVTLRNFYRNKDAAATLKAGIELGVFANGPTAMLMSGGEVHEYRLIALTDRWTLAHMYGTQVNEGSLVISVLDPSTVALALRLQDFAQDVDRDEEWDEGRRLSTLIADLTQSYHTLNDIRLSRLWHTMENPGDPDAMAEAAANTLTKALEDGNPEPFNRSTGGNSAYQISFMKLQDEIWLATARRLRPMLTKGRLEPDEAPSGQYILTAKAPE